MVPGDDVVDGAPPKLPFPTTPRFTLLVGDNPPSVERRGVRLVVDAHGGGIANPLKSGLPVADIVSIEPPAAAPRAGVDGALMEWNPAPAARRGSMRGLCP